MRLCGCYPALSILRVRDQPKGQLLDRGDTQFPELLSIPVGASASPLGFLWWGVWPSHCGKGGPFWAGAGVGVCVWGTDWVIKAETVMQDSFKPQLLWRQPEGAGEPWVSMETGSARLACQGEGGEGVPLPGGALTVPSPLQFSRASLRTSRPPSRQHRRACSAVSRDGWRVCPKPCTPGPRRSPRPAPRSTALACEASRRGWDSCARREGEGRSLSSPCAGGGGLWVWALALLVTRGPGTWDPGPMQLTGSRPLRLIPDPQGHLSEDTSMESSSPPFVPRAATPRQRRGLKTFLGTHRILERVGKSPCSWSQKPASTCRHPDPWSTPA